MPNFPKESDVSNAIRDYLDKRRVYNDRLNAGRVQTKRGSWIQMARKGTPDRFFILTGGRVGFVEVKRRGGKLWPEQIERHEELRRAGAVVLVADSLESFMNEFEKIEPLGLFRGIESEPLRV